MARTIITYRRRPTRLVVQSDATQTTGSAPLLPHELDGSAEKEKAKSPPDDATVQGYVDIAKGLRDTECREDAGRTFEAARRGILKRRR